VLFRPGRSSRRPPALVATFPLIWKQLFGVALWLNVYAWVVKTVYIPHSNLQNLSVQVLIDLSHVPILEISCCPHCHRSLSTTGRIPGCYSSSRIQHVGVNSEFIEILMLTEAIFPSTSFEINGSGCPPGSAHYVLSGISRFSLVYTLPKVLQRTEAPSPSPSASTKLKPDQGFQSAAIAKTAD